MGASHRLFCKGADRPVGHLHFVIQFQPCRPIVPGGTAIHEPLGFAIGRCHASLHHHSHIRFWVHGRHRHFPDWGMCGLELMPLLFMLPIWRVRGLEIRCRQPSNRLCHRRKARCIEGSDATCHLGPKPQFFRHRMQHRGRCALALCGPYRAFRWLRGLLGIPRHLALRFNRICHIRLVGRPV